MESVERYLDVISNQPEAEIRWSLKNATDEALMEIIISLLGLLKAYRTKCNVER